MSTHQKYRHDLLRTKPYCEYCKNRISVGQATLDHVMPRVRGGKNAKDNLVLTCKKCNSVKGDMTKERWDEVLPILRNVRYFTMSRRERRVWRDNNPGVLVYGREQQAATAQGGDGADQQEVQAGGASDVASERVGCGVPVPGESPE